MKVAFTFILFFWCLATQAQTTLTVIVKGEKSKNIIPVEVNFNCNGKPVRLSFTSTHKQVTLSDYEIKPTDSLYNFSITPTNPADQKKYLPYPVTNKLQLSSKNEDNILAITLTAIVKNTIYIRGLVQAADYSLMKDVTVVLADKPSITATTTAFGYYLLKIPLSSLPANYTSVLVSFSGSNRFHDVVKTVPLQKTVFDYPLNVVLDRKSTMDTIYGHLNFPTGFKGTVSYSVIQSGQTKQRLETDEDGGFHFIIDTLDASVDTFQLLFSSMSLADTTFSFKPENIHGLIIGDLPWKTIFVKRGRHAISAGVLFLPDDYFFTIGYYYHPNWMDQKIAFGARAGVAYLNRTIHYPVLDSTLESEKKMDEPVSVVFGLQGRYYWYAYNQRRTVNPYGEVALQFAPSLSLWQPSFGVGVIWNLKPLFAINGGARLAYNHFSSYEDVVFDYFGDAEYQTRSASDWKVYAEIQFIFFIPKP